ncbi:hypothetical protein FRC02_004725 [Tulasnella sp. 418]|nr:hypothetical protein FRC02_004725 [Tulasnella sp. 418]
MNAMVQSNLDAVHNLLSQTESNALAAFLSQITDSMEDSNNSNNQYSNNANDLNLAPEWALYTSPSSTVFQMPKGREQLAKATRDLMELASATNPPWSSSNSTNLPMPPPPYQSGPYPHQFLPDAPSWTNVNNFDSRSSQQLAAAQRRHRSSTQVVTGPVATDGASISQQPRRQSTSSSTAPRALVIPSTLNGFSTIDSSLPASLKRASPPDASSPISSNSSKRRRDSEASAQSDLASNLHNLLYNTPTSSTAPQTPLSAPISGRNEQLQDQALTASDRSQSSRLQNRSHSHNTSHQALTSNSASSSQGPLTIAPSVATASSSSSVPKESLNSRTSMLTSSASHASLSNSATVKSTTKLESSAPSASSTAASSSNNRPTLLTVDQKKQNHIHSEQKRRANIRKGYEALCEVIPALRDAIRAEEAACAATPGKKRGRGRLLGEDGEKMDGRAGPRSESVVLQKSEF